MSRGRRPIGALATELAFWLGLAGVAFALTFSFAGELGSYRWGAASWPRAIVMAIAVGAVAQFVLQLRARAASGARSDRPNFWPSIGDAGVRTNLRLAAALGLPLVYVYLMPWAGFYAATPAFLIAYLYCLGERRGGFLIAVPLLVYGLVLLVFGSLFYVALPTGKLPGFYDFSNWLLVLIR